MPSQLSRLARIVLLSALVALAVSSADAQSGRYQRQPEPETDVDPEVRVQQLENQLRRLTGQNEELQYRNRQLEEQLRQVQGAAPVGGARPSVAIAPPVQALPQRQPAQPQPAYEPQAAAPIVQESAAPAPQAPGRRRNDAFDPNQSPNAPGAPRALGGGQLPIPADSVIGAPGGRDPGEPLNLGNVGAAGPGVAPATLPPTQTPKDEFDLGIGYIQRRDYALAEETMRGFAQRYPSDPLLADSQYWLGESFYQRQRYRDAAESFLSVTTKFDTSAKAPDALLRLGQSLAALKEKEAACAALGEVTRKYPRASAGVKRAVDSEQKRVKC